jgi:uncharacterized protein (TIGR00162 family)
MARMENVVMLETPVLNAPILIEGLPGVGNVGKIATDYLAEKLGAKKFAEIYSKHFPPQVTLNGDCVAQLACNELYYSKDVSGRDLVFLLGDFQGLTPEGQYDVADRIVDIAVSLKVSKIYTLGGYGIGTVVEKPRVLGAVTDVSLKEELERHGVTFVSGEPAAGIAGASGLILGMSRVKGIDAACLMGETSGFFIDHKSSSVLLKVLVKILNVDIDMKELDERSQQMDEFTSKIKELAEDQNKNQLGYIG